MQSSPRLRVRVCAAFLLIISSSLAAHAALKAAPGYRARTVLETAPFTVAGGLTIDVDGYAMYCGSGTNIFRWDFPYGTPFAPSGAIPPNTDISALAAVNGDVFAASGTSFSSPFPHNFGRLSGGIYSNLFALDGIFDASASWYGQIFLVANPGASNSAIFQFDQSSNSVTEIVKPGGYSGGMTFRDGDGIYYADQNSGAILRYADTNLTVIPMDDPMIYPPPAGSGPQIDPQPQVVASNVWGGYLAFDSKDRLLVTTGYGNELRAYDRWGGTLVEKVAWDDVNGNGIGQVVQNWWSRETVLVFTDWAAYRSKVVALRPFWTGNDTDGNHIANIVAFDSRSAAWKMVAPESNTTTTATWGKRNEQPIVGDFDGDGIGDTATRNVLTGEWNIRYSGPVIMSKIYPQPTTKLPAGSQNIPCAADYFNDGTTDPAVYNKRTGQFSIGGGYVIMEKSRPTIVPYPPVGIPGGIPVPGDYDGDGFAEPVVYIPGSGQWLVSLGDVISSLGQWGWSGAAPVQADYDGDGRTDLAVFNRDSAVWNILRSSDGKPQQIQFGFAGCVPAAADYDGDQKTDVAVYDPKSGNFWTFRSTGGLFHANLGANLQIVKP